MKLQSNNELELAYNFIEFTNRNVFLTGKAGTGKTTFLHNLRSKSGKRLVVTAPTGVAAINAKGVTIHSFFQLPFGPVITESVSGIKQPAGNGNTGKFSKNKIKIIKSLDLLVIDEVSMVRADIMDAIDDVLRQYRDSNLPFGGVQLLLIGDLQQLAPVIKNDERQILEEYYDTLYFFGSKALKSSNPVFIELKHIFRQKDDKFIKILNEVRDDRLSQQSKEELNRRYKKDAGDDISNGYITLTTHNAIADRINDKQLSKLKGKAFTFTADVEGTFPENSYPTDYNLTLKKGAQVMFIKNDSSPAKEYYNGKTGVITAIDDDDIEVTCEDDDEPVVLHREIWENIKYYTDSKTAEIKEDIIGSFTQFPLRLAWAITIHKSQGLTFEKAIIDAELAFAHGQIYVALSRCKSLNGLILSSKIKNESIICDRQVISFNRWVEENQPTKTELDKSKLDYQLFLIFELFEFRPLISYLNRLKSIFVNNRNIIEDTYLKTLEQTITSVSGLIEVADKFKIQIKHLLFTQGDIGLNEPLQDRIRKASTYFKDKLEDEIITNIQTIDIETDNKSVNKKVAEALKKIDETLYIKHECLKISQIRFDVYEYLKTKAKSSLKPKKIRLKAKKVTDNEPISLNSRIYNKLIEWRREKANEEGVPLYFVAHQKLLKQIAAALPQTEQQLKEIKGMGNKKIKKYGAELLRLITS